MNIIDNITKIVNQLNLQSNAAHVWDVAISQWDPSLFRDIVSKEEILHSRRLRLERDRHQYIVSHGLLRSLIVGYVPRKMGELKFKTNAFGKPSLDDSLNPKNLKFNLSHSGSRTVFGFAWNSCLGVDIEQITGNVDIDEIANYLYSTRERKNLEAMVEPIKTNTFFRYWVRREAYLKAKGEGFAFKSQQKIDFSTLPPTFMRDHLDRLWSWMDIPTGEHYVGALAMEGSKWNVLYIKMDVVDDEIRIRLLHLN